MDCNSVQSVSSMSLMTSHYFGFVKKVMLRIGNILNFIRTFRVDELDLVLSRSDMALNLIWLRLFE